jgi:hypothetical protein
MQKNSRTICIYANSYSFWLVHFLLKCVPQERTNKELPLNSVLYDLISFAKNYKLNGLRSKTEGISILQFSLSPLITNMDKIKLMSVQSRLTRTFPTTELTYPQKNQGTVQLA